MVTKPSAKRALPYLLKNSIVPSWMVMLPPTMIAWVVKLLDISSLPPRMMTSLSIVAASMEKEVPSMWLLSSPSWTVRAWLWMPLASSLPPRSSRWPAVRRPGLTWAPLSVRRLVAISEPAALPSPPASVMVSDWVSAASHCRAALSLAAVSRFVPSSRSSTSLVPNTICMVATPAEALVSRFTPASVTSAPAGEVMTMRSLAATPGAVLAMVRGVFVFTVRVPSA